jgi:hypothetical protein
MSTYLHLRLNGLSPLASIRGPFFAFFAPFAATLTHPSPDVASRFWRKDLPRESHSSRFRLCVAA